MEQSEFFFEISNNQPNLIMKKKSFFLLFLIIMAFSCAKDDLMDTGQNGLYDATLKCTGSVITVSPTGIDDTQNLLDAFDLAKTKGCRAVVKLMSGTFYLDMIEIHEFCGTFAGSGKGTTIVTNLPDINPDEVIAAKKLPALIAFIGGNVTVSDMSVRMSEGLSWPESMDKCMLLFSDYSAEFIPAQKQIKVNLRNIEVTGLQQNNLPYEAFHGVMLTPDRLYESTAIPRSHIDADVSNCDFSWFAYNFYVHGCDGGNLVFGMNEGNTFAQSYRALAINENTGVNAIIVNNDFSCTFGTCLDLNSGEEGYFGIKQFEDATMNPGTYLVRNNTIYAENAMATGIMDVWRWTHPEKPTWMNIKILNNLYHLAGGNYGSFIMTYCVKNLLFENNTLKNDGSIKGLWISNFWWQETSDLNMSEGVKILHTNTSDITVDFWFGPSKDCLLVGDLTDFLVYDDGENNKIIDTSQEGVAPKAKSFNQSQEGIPDQSVLRKNRMNEIYKH